MVRQMLTMFFQMLNENCADLENKSKEVPDSFIHSQTQAFDASILL